MDIDLSGLSMRFLRAAGPNIPIDMFYAVDSDDDSSSSSDATSLLMEQELKQKAANRTCAEHRLYNNNVVPTGFTLRGIFAVQEDSSGQRQQQVPILNLSRPIIIDRSALFENHAATLNELYILNILELVPWKPVTQAIAIQVYAALVEHLEIENQQKLSLQNFVTLSGPIFEFEAQQFQPGPEAALNMKKPTKPSKRSMGLPTTASVRNPASPVVDKQIRRSPCLRAANDGFSYTWLGNNPMKKQKITALQIDPTLGQVGPVSISTLQGWGVQCGVAPGELTEEALMQAPTDGDQQRDHE